MRQQRAFGFDIPASTGAFDFVLHAIMSTSRHLGPNFDAFVQSSSRDVGRAATRVDRDSGLPASRMVECPSIVPQALCRKPTFPLSAKPYRRSEVSRNPFSWPVISNLTSCLYHTVNILLHRPRLSTHVWKDGSGKGHRASSAAACISSANDIVSIFDLFRRTFGLGQVILSLGYSIYTAVSIFLLEVRASTTLVGWTPSGRLAYCIEVLESIKSSSPSESYTRSNKTCDTDRS